MEAITIVGGGIAGLALAAGLDPERFDVTVHEQRPGLPAVESSLAMWPEAQRALAALGVLTEVRKIAVPLGGMALRDGAGNAWLCPEVHGVLGVSRAGLLSVLEAAVPPSVHRTTGRVQGPRGPARPCSGRGWRAQRGPPGAPRRARGRSG